MMQLEGTYTALVTPFRDEPGQPIDWAALDALVDAQVAGGVAGVVPCGTTGESPTLSHEEHAQVVERVIARAKGRVQVVAGAVSNSTREAVVLARVPIVVYNVPVRTGSDLAAETLARIAEAAPNVVATKEATGNVLRAQRIAQLMGSRMTVLCGDDALTLPMVAVGARGVISVTSNLLPAEVSRATRLALEGKMEEARRAHLALVPVHEAMFLEANPSPVKAALAARGAMSDAVRGPLARCSEATRKAVVAAVDTYARSASGPRPKAAPVAPQGGEGRER
jgi:4-hydroxy-tetrahydrodipicolinate synthase